jgi:tetratricopeptide (TPR) repeat protein
MNNQSTFVKIVIWFMVFLMSAGFAALVIAPFAQNLSVFGGDDGGRGATRELVDEARADIRKDNCADEKKKPTGKRLDRCKEAYQNLASSYTTLATPAEGDTAAPRDSKRNLERAHDAWKALYELDPADDESAVRYANSLRESGKTQQSLEIFQKLVKENPKNEDYLLAQAGSYEAIGNTDEAIATYRLFIKRFPESGQIEQIKEQIKNLQEQAKQQAAGGGQQPITVG